MRTNLLELDNFIDPAVGAEASYHAIQWERGREPSVLPVSGNIHRHRLPEAGTREHVHEFGELVLVLSGKIIHRVNGSIQRLAAGDVAFVRPSDRHAFAPAPGLEPCEILLLSFHLELFSTVGKFFEDHEFLARYTADVLPAVFRLPENRMNAIASQLIEMNAAAPLPAIRRIRFKAVLAGLFADCFLPAAEDAANGPPWLTELCEKMRRPENFIAGLHRMQQLSGYTPEHLCKVFRRCRGESPTAFINALRVNHAARLLAESDSPIADIAWNLRFKSLGRFYLLFKQFYACPPAEYRKRALQARKLL